MIVGVTMPTRWPSSTNRHRIDLPFAVQDLPDRVETRLSGHLGPLRRGDAYPASNPRLRQGARALPPSRGGTRPGQASRGVPAPGRRGEPGSAPSPWGGRVDGLAKPHMGRDCPDLSPSSSPGLESPPQCSL